ncbi:hypothetical protein NDR87_29950 [Nocardia sp. CDC159]|uniref:Lipoprotein n=1 Tax=Nocardia pulmonis TaxID=2951408 RepID=A0A9X2J231_9NOCA|nr:MULTISPECIES: hypothetical protein [Nocardia]MCM6777596.1 hypothetical protein [Nocardia pulmonis]MCM6790600.1 hypothetical protein [Nocardia sp. CDC159]
MRPLTRVCGALLAQAAVLATLGCNVLTLDPERHGESSPAAGAVRHDPEPLMKNFPLIGRPVAVSWVTWDNSSGRAPGPSTYWLDAIVELEPETAAALRSRYTPTEPADPPALHDALRSAVPSGPYLSGAEFDAVLGGSEQWDGSATGYLHRDRPILVFQASAGG